LRQAAQVHPIIGLKFEESLGLTTSAEHALQLSRNQPSKSVSHVSQGKKNESPDQTQKQTGWLLSPPSTNQNMWQSIRHEPCPEPMSCIEI